MFLITITAVAAVCGAAKLDRAYLPPPPSAKLAGGSPGSLQTPFIGNSINQRIGGIPKGGYTNDFEGVVVEAVAPGTRASSPDDTNLGAPRITYGSIYSKVGEEAFKLDSVDGIRHLPKDSHAGLNKESATENGKHDFRNINKIPNSEAIERTQAAQDRLAETIRSENEMGPNGYKYSFETNNGILVQENAIESEGVQAMGHFAYKSDDGQIYSVTYTADSNGFKPVGDHIPTPPPIPKEILDSLEQNARDEAAGLVDDGTYDAQKYNTGGDYNQRGEANGQYNDKQLLNNEERPELLTNGEVLHQNNRHFGSQKLTQVQFGFNKNLNRPSTENNKRNQSNQDNFNYENRYTEKEKNDYNANLVTSFNNQHKNYNEPIGSSVHFPAKIKLTDRNQNIPLRTYSQTPLSLSVTASGNKLSSNSNYHMSNKENSPHTFAYNNIVNRNNGAQEQGHSGVGIVSTHQFTPESILTTPHESSPTQNNNYQESQNGFSFKHFTANHKMSASVAPNSSQKDLQFNSRPNTQIISGSSSELTQPLFSSQIFKTQDNMKLSNNFNKSPELGLKGNRFLENYRTQETLDNGFRNSNKENILTSQNYQTQSQYDRTSHLSNIKIQDFQNIPRNQYKPILPQTAHNQNSYSSSLKGDSYYYNPTSTSINIPQDQHPKFDIGSNSKTQFTEQNFLTTPSHSKTELEHETASHIRPTKEFIVPTFPLKMKENYQGIILQSQVNGITQASALPLNSRLQSFSTLQSNHLGMQQIQKDSSTVSLPSNKFPLKQHVGQGLPLIQPNYSQETIVPSSQYTGELYQYNKPPETMPAPSNTDTNSKFTSELYVYNKPPETLQTPPDMTQKQLQQLSQGKDVHSSISNTQIHKPTSLFIPTTSQKVSEKLTLENGNHETHHRQQCCQESYNSHNDLSQSPMKTENQGFSSQYQIPGQSFVGQGEVFSGPREIPRFDSSGYHY